MFSQKVFAGMPVTDVKQEMHRMLDKISMSKAKVDVIQRNTNVIESTQILQDMMRSLDRELYQIESVARRQGADTSEISRSIETYRNTSRSLNQRIQGISRVLESSSNVIMNFIDSPQVETAKSSAMTSIGIQELNQNLNALQTQQLLIELERKKSELNLKSKLSQEAQETYIRASNIRQNSYKTFKSIISVDGAKEFKKVASKAKEDKSAYMWGPL